MMYESEGSSSNHLPAADEHSQRRNAAPLHPTESPAVIEGDDVRFWIEDSGNMVSALVTKQALLHVADGHPARGGYVQRFRDYRQTFEALAIGKSGRNELESDGSIRIDRADLLWLSSVGRPSGLALASPRRLLLTANLPGSSDVPPRNFFDVFSAKRVEKARTELQSENSPPRETLYRQGDVLLRRSGDQSCIAAQISEEVPVLAEGELSGHSHRVFGGAVMFRDDGLARELGEQTYVGALDIPSGGGELRHVDSNGSLTGEHDTIQLPHGRYIVERQREYDPEGTRRAID
jgi:hypothetical protein